MVLLFQLFLDQDVLIEDLFVLGWEDSLGLEKLLGVGLAQKGDAFVMKKGVQRDTEFGYTRGRELFVDGTEDIVQGVVK